MQTNIKKIRGPTFAKRSNELSRARMSEYTLLVPGMLDWHSGSLIVFNDLSYRDTVSSVGIGRDLLPGTADGMHHVCHFRHALALDERRVKFLPEYAGRGCMIPTAPVNARLVKSGKPWTVKVKEVWFAGTHSDM